MNSFKLKTEEEKFKLYEGFGYKIYQDFYSEDFFSISCDKADKFLPNIFSTKDKYDRVTGFRIETASLGALEREDIQKIIKGYETALIAVKQLEEMFVVPYCNGDF